MSERTLAIIKPDAVKKNAIGDIIASYEKAGLKPAFFTPGTARRCLNG